MAAIPRARGRFSSATTRRCASESREQLREPSSRMQLTASCSPRQLDLLHCRQLLSILLSDTLRDEAVAYFRADENEPLLHCMVHMLRVAADSPTSIGSPSRDDELFAEKCLAEKSASRLFLSVPGRGRCTSPV